MGARARAAGQARGVALSEFPRRERSEGAYIGGASALSSVERASERRAPDLARAPASTICGRGGVGAVRWRGGFERALGAALASGLDGAGRPSDAGGWVSDRGGAAKSPRLALERLQCNNSSTSLARSASGKEWEAKWSGDVPGEKGAAARRTQGLGGCCVGAVWWWGKARRRRAVVRGGRGPYSDSGGGRSGPRPRWVGLGCSRSEAQL